MYVYDIVASLTGELIAPVTSAVKSHPDCTTRLHSVGSAKIDFHLRDGEPLLSQPEWRMATEHWSRTLVRSWVDGAGVKTADYAGLISAVDWDATTGVLSVETEELESQTAWRNITGVSTYDPDGALTVSGKSQRGLLRAVLQAGLNRGDSSFYWNYPVDVGPDSTGGYSLNEPHHKLRTTAEIIKEIRDTATGPDVYLQPEWRAGKLWWAVKYGSPRLPGVSFQWSQSAPKRPILAKTRRDGKKMTTGVFAAGEGEGSAMLVGLGDPADSSKGLTYYTPYRDRTIDFAQVADQGTLNALALGELEAHFYSIEAKKFTLTIDEDVNPAALQIGSRIDVWTDGDEYEPEGMTRGYLIGKTGSATKIDLEVLPWV